jgi:hypothetical protein
MMIDNVISFHAYTILEFNLIPVLINICVFLTWSGTHFDIAFYLYCLASPLFRKKFIKITDKMAHCSCLYCVSQL